MMKLSIEELMNYMLDLFDNTEKRLHEKYEELSYIDKELDDLDHFIECRRHKNKLNASEHAKVDILRQELRVERREVKNDIDMIETVKRFTDKYKNKLITGDIIKNLKEQRKLKKRQENPVYTYKTNIIEKLNKTHAKS